jgi:hypothetical protein
LQKTNSPVLATGFLALNLIFATLILIIENLTETPEKRVFMQILKELIFLFPLLLVIFLLLGGSFYVLSVVAGGKSSFRQTISVLGFSSFPLIGLFLPMVSSFLLLWWIISVETDQLKDVMK